MTRSKRPASPAPIKAWSFSRYSVYTLCPAKAKYGFVDKIKEPPNDAMARGAAIHDTAEGYIKGKVARMPKELKLFAELFRYLRKEYKKVTSQLVIEDIWAFDEHWNPCRWDDWANCRVRIKLDCAEIHSDGSMTITDWKTGKYNSFRQEEYVEQLELYALAALLLHEHVEVALPRLAYLDHGIVFPEPGSDEEKSLTFTRKDIPKLKKAWNKRAAPMLRDKRFAPRPNNLCKWCFYRSDNKLNGGGQCKF